MPPYGYNLYICAILSGLGYVVEIWKRSGYLWVGRGKVERPLVLSRGRGGRAKSETERLHGRTGEACPP